MAFSGALTLTDLNDFITPAQACIKPVEQEDKPEQRDAGAALTEIQIDSSGAYYEVSAADKGTNKKLAQAQISLNDCLACSGCITSAESVLITLQSHTEVLEVLAANEVAEDKKIAVVSIAPQSLASLAALLSITPRQVLRRLRPFLRSLGFAYIFDTNYGRELALREHVREFEERRAAAERGEEGQLPMLASACPGWICYAEKTHHEMLPYIARTKSPQQVMGTLVKGWMAGKWGKTPDGVYHVTVMPCYDKKLEASRKDFYDEVYRTREVDCVITTGELEVMLREKGWDLSVAVEGELDGERMVDGGAGIRLAELVEHRGTSSGSYLHWIMAGVLRDRAGATVEVKTMRNADYEEYTIRDEGRVVFKGATCYGFRNLQNVVRKVGKEQGVRTGTGAAGRLGAGRRGRAGETEKKYDYVEVMACPGGCVNGGGQLKGDGREWTKRVEAAYWLDGERPETETETETEIGGLELRTEYRAVESEVVGLAVKW